VSLAFGSVDEHLVRLLLRSVLGRLETSALSFAINTTMAERMVEMDAQEHEHEHGNNDDARTHREKAISKLDEIVRLVRQRLVENKIDISLFFLIPRSGEAIVTFGTISDPSDQLWEQINDLVSSVVQDVIGVQRLKCRSVVCAASDGASL
jgi:hypothetical protein